MCVSIICLKLSIVYKTKVGLSTHFSSSKIMNFVLLLQ
jgi:hypothetical protein